MRRATLTIEGPHPAWREIYTVEDAGDGMVLPLVFRVVNAVVGAHPSEIASLTAALQTVAITVSTCAGPVDVSTQDGV